MSDQSSNLRLTFIAQGQAQKHVTVNETFLRLDALVQLSALSASTTVQPGSPLDGAVYILPTGKSGSNWTAMANWALAYYRDGVWEEIAPRQGWLAYVSDTQEFLVYSGAGWAHLPAGLATDAEARALTDAKKALTASNLAARACFSAHKNSTHQTGIASAAFTKISFGTEEFDIGGFYDASVSRWTPPAGRVRLSATVYFSAGLTIGGIIEIHIYKNGALHRGQSDVAVATTGSLTVSCLANANGADYFEAYVYATSGSTATAFGVATYTHFQGEQI